MILRLSLHGNEKVSPLNSGEPESKDGTQFQSTCLHVGDL